MSLESDFVFPEPLQNWEEEKTQINLSLAQQRRRRQVRGGLRGGWPQLSLATTQQCQNASDRGFRGTGVWDPRIWGTAGMKEPPAAQLRPPSTGMVPFLG